MRAFFLFVLLCSSCVSMRDNSDGAGESLAGSESALSSQPATAEAKPKESDVDFAALEFSVASAERRVAAAELSGELRKREAELKLHAAELAVEKAEASLEHLENYTMPTRLAKEQISLDRSAGSLADAKAELQQMRDMYKDEEFAESTKELVITRSERNVDLQKRNLELAKAARDDLESFELAQEHADAVRKLAEAREQLELARMRKLETERGIEAKALDAAEALRKARRALEKARAKAGDSA